MSAGLSCTKWRTRRLFWWFYEADIGLWVALAIVIGLWFISRGN